MSFEFIEGVGIVHFNLTKPARVVPGHERHKWSRKPLRGQTAVCLKCGTAKCYRLSYEVVYRRAGEAQILTERPTCTGGQKGGEGKLLSEPEHERQASTQ
ncbi:hypothetical protein [Hymenobacter sp. YC55]|uniref:hypothetical protein n=1 Tax=Hymenobacter sp. YC55 TaxID=3034019 RepID=UPI0023F78C7E|nr:hypothetical protein [Hymenobacter sp. YC55]MDF7813629.1 hypothetical protein [Hymenobacter sp. YC55]